MSKLLVICGPTATGKTKLAAHLAKKFNGVLVSSDSRQVYRRMDIGTGKERPEGVEVCGYDLVEPTQDFSVSDFIEFAEPVITNSLEKGKLPILVGGTGLYIKGIVDGIETAQIPPNHKLRKTLMRLSADELLIQLTKINHDKAFSMNESDRKNPRRLIRAIEIAQHKLFKSSTEIKKSKHRYDVLFVGLSAPFSYLQNIIKVRVKERVKAGVEKEIKRLLESGVGWEDQSMSSTSYRPWKEYFEGSKSKDQVIFDWTLEEIRYARRQVTWFKKDNHSLPLRGKRINWFDITEPDYQNNVEKLVNKWYSKSK